METKRWEEIITDEQWDNEARSDIEFEKSRDELSKDPGKRFNEDPNKKPRMILHPDVSLRKPRAEASLTLKLAKKKPKSKRLKKEFGRVIRVLGTGLFSHKIK